MYEPNVGFWPHHAPRLSGGLESLGTLIAVGLLGLGAVSAYSVYRIAGGGKRGLAIGAVGAVGVPAAYLWYKSNKHRWAPAPQAPADVPKPYAPTVVQQPR